MVSDENRHDANSGKTERSDQSVGFREHRDNCLLR